ncbi:hypothetical protein [Neobacillus niacini]|nr:hypothetical protein [Neobacillus niacini]MCM3766135.1 hypothetical protein [Neobacillus niacini]
MEFYLNCYDSALPCEVTIDEDNGRYMLRKSDSSGEFFNNPTELIEWIKRNWTGDEFIHPDEFRKMISFLEENYC